MRFKYLLGVTCGFAMANAASAQIQPPAQQKQAPAQAPQLQNNRLAQQYPPALYQMNDVSKSLNLTQDQMGNLNKLSEQTRAQYRDNYEKLNSLNGNERLAREQELNRQYYGEWNKGARSVFNDNQWNRYQQLNYQHEGFNALYDPDIQKRLNLTSDQARRLDEQRAWSQQQMQEINRTGATDATKGSQMYRDYWKQHDERFNKYLTPEQQKIWQGMTGERYEFQPAFTPSR